MTQHDFRVVQLNAEGELAVTWGSFHDEQFARRVLASAKADGNSAAVLQFRSHKGWETIA